MARGESPLAKGTKMQNKLLGSVCALALGLLPLAAAHADGWPGFSGTLSGDYANLHANGGGSADSWGGTGAAKFNFGTAPFAAQFDGGYHNINGSGASVDDWNLDGSVMWLAPMGRAGAVVGYNNLNGGGSAHVTNYGGYGEWFAGPGFTLGGKAGGFSGSGSTDGYYLGGQVVGYLGGSFALSGAVDYTHLSHAGNDTDYTARGEYLISQRVPVSIYGGYTYSSFSGGGGHLDTWFVGLKFYCNGSGEQSLADRQRGGPVSWPIQFGPAIFKF